MCIRDRVSTQSTGDCMRTHGGPDQIKRATHSMAIDVRPTAHPLDAKPNRGRRRSIDCPRTVRSTQLPVPPTHPRHRRKSMDIIHDAPLHGIQTRTPATISSKRSKRPSPSFQEEIPNRRRSIDNPRSVPQVAQLVARSPQGRNRSRRRSLDDLPLNDTELALAEYPIGPELMGVRPPPVEPQAAASLPRTTKAARTCLLYTSPSPRDS
eukprot:TRINITY_DN13072_c0_g1_i10.p1 TRINITY_DN13072_c0_g1~~TRINITY_DN13072_c0_g1_i10.p1  ORF type:complete len:209 (+),score=28.78 TRINITY_DN13072_c0_g1_i10:140-766(+)